MQPALVQIRDIQNALTRAGYDPGPADGVRGQKTINAIEAFQRDHGRTPDGAVGPQTQAALFGQVAQSDSFQPASGRSYRAQGTGYYPANTRLEGGAKDRLGNPLHTLQDYLSGRAPYVSVAMDSKAFPYGTKLRIPELEAKYGRPIEFRVVDTGGAFRGRGTGRIDICTANQRASLDPAINGPLTLVVQ